MHRYTARHNLTKAGQQHGAVLLTALVFLLAFTLAVLSSSQQLLTERRIDINQNDQAMADSLAQIALTAAEQKVQSMNTSLANLTTNELYGEGGQAGMFTRDCRNPATQRAPQYGLCLDTAHARELRPVTSRLVNHPDLGQIALLSPCGHALEYPADTTVRADCTRNIVYSGKTLWANPRYVIELIDPQYTDHTMHTSRLYRITARAWGKDKDTEATAQRYIAVPDPASRQTAWLKLLEPVTP